MQSVHVVPLRKDPNDAVMSTDVAQRRERTFQGEWVNGANRIFPHSSSGTPIRNSTYFTSTDFDEVVIIFVFGVAAKSKELLRSI